MDRRFTKRIFASLFEVLDLLPDSIMVVRQILVLFVEVRILVGQHISILWIMRHAVPNNPRRATLLRSKRGFFYAVDRPNTPITGTSFFNLC